VAVQLSLHAPKMGKVKTAKPSMGGASKRADGIAMQRQDPWKDGVVMAKDIYEKWRS
jgi:hypothetical protein